MNNKPKSVRTISILIIIFSSIIMFTNTMGAISFILVGSGDDITINGPTGELTNDDPMSFFFDYYIEFCSGMILIALGYLIGGIFIQKFRLWANKLLTTSALLSLVMIWGLMIVMAVSIGQSSTDGTLSLIPIIIGILWSTPVVLLIWFLNRKKIKQHFS